MTNRSRSDWDALTLRALTTVVALLALGAFTLSFDALRELAIMAGLRARLAFLWPLIVDGFIVVATAAAVVMRGRSWKQTWYPWATLILFAAISVTGNALHARSAADTSHVGVTVAAVVSAVPAVALLLASHLFVLVLEGPPVSGPPVTSTRHINESGRAVTMQEPTPTPARPEPKKTGAPAPTGEWQVWIAGQLAAGRELTGTDVADHFGVSPATGRRRLASVKASALPGNLALVVGD